MVAAMQPPDSHARLHGRNARSVRFDLHGRGGTSRKWAPWMISANSCGLIERSNGEAQVFLRSNNSSGKIYAVTEGQYLLAPGEGKPCERYERLLALDRAGERDLVARGCMMHMRGCLLPSRKNSVAVSRH